MLPFHKNHNLVYSVISLPSQFVDGSYALQNHFGS